MLERLERGKRFAARLAAHIAPERIRTDPLYTFAYAGDASYFRLIPAAVVFINTEDDVRHVLARARAEGLPVTFRAAGTSLSGQAVTDGVLAVLGDGWRKIAIAPGAEEVTLGPAIIVAHANAALKRYNKKIGPDPASQATCKIGGVVANNSSGMCCGVAQNTYHTMTRLRLMLADGTVLDSGDPDSVAAFRDSHRELLAGIAQLHADVMADAELTALIRRKYRIKNTVGYALNALVDYHDPVDILIHLMVGSEGTLGFVSEVTYNTVPDHPHKSTALVPFPEPYACARAITKLSNGGVQVTSGVTAAEYIERRALATVEHLPAMAELLPYLGENSPAVLIDVTAPDAETLASEVEKAEAILASEGATAINFSTDKTRSDALWDIRKGFFASGGATRPKGTSMLTEDVAAPIDRLADFVIAMRELLDRHGYYDAIIFGHALAGNLHFQMSADFADPESAGKFDAFSTDLSKLVSIDYAGSLKAEHGTGRAIAAFVEAEWGEKAYGLMKRIKALFDPENLLNPGVLITDDDQTHVKNLKPMPLADPLVDLCIECGFCEPACPSLQMTLSPRQRIAVTRERARLRRSGEEPQRLAALDAQFEYAGMDTCAACNLCSLRCPVGIETGTMIIGQRGDRHGGAAHKIASAVAGQTGLAETLLRTGVGAQAALRHLVGDGPVDAMNALARKASFDRIPQTLPTLTPGPGAPKRQPAQADAPRGDIVYFPSCPSRIFGSPETGLDLLSLPDAMLALLRRAGFNPIVPDNATGLCCGRAFSSKGYAEAAKKVRGQWHEAMRTLSGDGEKPIVTDTSSCVVGSAAQADLPLDLADSAEFMAREILPHLSVKTRLPVVAVHHNCSAQRMKEQSALEALAAACADQVAVLSSVTCCGFAGDRGLEAPELNAHAVRFAKSDIPGDCEIGVTTVSTCGTGLSHHTGVPFVSIVALLEYVSRP